MSMTTTNDIKFVSPDPFKSKSLCRNNEYVENHKCVMCPYGEVHDPGDDPKGKNTMCDGKYFVFI